MASGMSSQSDAQSQTPYRLNDDEVRKASTALLKHMRKSQSDRAATAKDLFKASASSSEESSDPIWLILSTKKHISDTKRLKPGKIPVPHTLIKPDSSICLITADPQRAYKDAIAEAAFPEDLRTRIRVLGMEKVRQRYKSFESRRQLAAEYDTFLADDRVIDLLPKLLGKSIYEGTKRPTPVHLMAPKQKSQPQPSGEKAGKVQKRIAKPESMAREIQKALASAKVRLSPSATTAIMVGYSHFDAEALQANIDAVVKGLVERFITSGWRNIRSIHIKGPETVAMPIWLASELWEDADDVLDDEAAAEAKLRESQKGGRKGAKRVGEPGPQQRKRKLLTEGDDGFNKDMTDRREALRQAKRMAMAEAEKVAVAV